MNSGQMPATLDDLILRAEHFASFAMRQMGRVPAAVMALTPEQLLFFMPETMGDDRAKDSFAAVARLICIAHDVSAVVMILEAWMKVATPGEPLDTSERPSESFDRREVVVLAGEARAAKRLKFLPILRTDAGGFFGFGEPDLPEFESFQGRFAEILGPEAPSPEDQAKARLVLRALGINDGDLLRGNPRWS